MIETLSVSLSGPAFTFLLYENLKNRYSQEGFLIGEFSEKETKTITDHDQQQLTVSRVIRISCAVPSPQPFFFYDSVGRINSDKIRNFLGDLTPKVIAWYKYKPSSSFSFTFREKIIHKQLSKLFYLPPEFFSCCLLISESSDNNSTHSFTQTFTRYHNNNYEQLPVHIVNLSQNSQLYKSPELVSDTFSNLVSALKINHKKTQGLSIITTINHALAKYTDQIVEQLAGAEERLFQLEDEIKKMQANKNEKDLNASNNKENVNDVIIDTDLQVSPASSPTKTRGRGKSTTPGPTKPKRNSSQSPTKRNSGGREIVTRSMKKV